MNSHRRRGRHTSRASRKQAAIRASQWWRRGIGTATAAMVLSTTLVAQSGITTNATWNDNEWVSTAPITTSDCTTPEGVFTTRGAGKLLSGQLLTIDLDDLADVAGVEVTNNGSRSRVTPDVPETPEDSDAYSHPLDVSVLGLPYLSFGDLLEIPLETQTGVIGQYAQATRSGNAIGAFGTVTNDGGISLDRFDGDVPDLATLSLSSLLNATELGLGNLLSDVTDLELKVGALGGRAFLDGCKEKWGQPDELQREYITSHVDLNLTSPTVGALGTTIGGVTNTLEDTANGLIGDENVLSSVVGQVVSLVQGVLGSPLLGDLLGLLLGLKIDSGVPATATITALNLDLRSIRDLIDKPVASADGSVSVVLSEGLVSIITDALLSAAYPDDADDPYPYGLNQLPPNTEPLTDPQVLSTLTDRLGALLTGIVDKANTDLLTALDNAETNIELSVPVETKECLLCGWKKSAISITVSGSLTELLQNEADINIDLTAVPLAGNILTELLNLLTNALLGTVGNILGSVIDGILRPLASLPSDLLTTTADPILTLVSTLYTNLFLSDVVSLMFNAQNEPRSGSPEPQDWKTTEPRGIPPGQYDVAAIRLGVIDAARSAAIWLYLGRGSVGPVCTQADVAAGGCAGY